MRRSLRILITLIHSLKNRITCLDILMNAYIFSYRSFVSTFWAFNDISPLNFSTSKLCGLAMRWYTWASRFSFLPNLSSLSVMGHNRHFNYSDTFLYWRFFLICWLIFRSNIAMESRDFVFQYSGSYWL